MSAPAADVETADEPSPFYDVGVGLAAGIGGILLTILWFYVLGTATLLATGDAELSAVGEVMLAPPASGLGLGSAALFYLRAADEPPSFFDVSWPSLRDVGFAVGGLVALFAAVQGIGMLFAEFQVTTAEHGTIQTLREAESAVSLYLAGAAIVFIGPGEELLFRNVIQKRLYDSFSRHGAILVGSVIFAAVHFNAYAAGSPGQILASLSVVFALSVLLGWLYHRTESVVVPAAVHGGYDAILFGSIYVEQAAALV